METPDTVHGRLLEAVHLSGYTFERACSELEWLLDEDRWKRIGGGFQDINAFLSTIDLSEFRLAIDQRKKLAKRLQEIEASQRTTAQLLGVGVATVNRDLHDVPNGTTKPDLSIENNAEETGSVPDGTPAWFQDEEIDPAKLAKKEETRKGAGERREARLTEISAGNSDLGTTIRYPIIYADPPWRYENPPIGASGRSIENHYPTMTLDEICALPVAELATDDAILYLWATAPKLVECLQVVEAWGFVYRTCLVWDKQIIGMGYHARSQHEILLVSRRGDFPPPLAGTQPSSLHSERRGEHSAKPVFYYDMIERCYPTVPKIELFARSAREGWAAWGNQASETTDAA